MMSLAKGFFLIVVTIHLAPTLLKAILHRNILLKDTHRQVILVNLLHITQGKGLVKRCNVGWKWLEVLQQPPPLMVLCVTMLMVRMLIMVVALESLGREVQARKHEKIGKHKGGKHGVMEAIQGVEVMYSVT